jgi:hypothetical protein
VTGPPNPAPARPRPLRAAATLLVLATFAAVAGCGDDEGGPRAELADELVDGVGFEVDESCVRERTEQLSEDDARFLLDNFDARSSSDFDDDLQTWIAGLFDCVVGADPADDATADPADVVACMDAAGYPLLPGETMPDDVAEILGIVDLYVLDVEASEVFGSVTFYDSVGRAEADVQAASAAASDDQAVGRVGIAVYAVEDQAADAVRSCLEA